MNTGRTHRGALHAHTTLSHDGTMSLDQLVSFLKGKGYHFLGLTEHSYDLTADDMAGLEREAAAISDDSFLVIPGVEFRCVANVDIIGYGVTALTDTDDPMTVIEHIHTYGGVAVLAHPLVRNYPLDLNWIARLDGWEIWNVSNEGKYLPQLRTLKKYREYLRQCPDLKSFAGLDLHRTASFYPLATVVGGKLDRTSILATLRAGDFSIDSPYFVGDSRGTAGFAYGARLIAATGLFNGIRRVRGLFRGN